MLPAVLRGLATVQRSAFPCVHAPALRAARALSRSPAPALLPAGASHRAARESKLTRWGGVERAGGGGMQAWGEVDMGMRGMVRLPTRAGKETGSFTSRDSVMWHKLHAEAQPPSRPESLPVPCP